MLFSISEVSAQSSTSIPEWVKNIAKWWSTDLITDNEFAFGIAYMINEKIIRMDDILTDSNTIAFDNHIVIPKFTKDTVILWSDGAISDDNFRSGLQIMIKQESVSSKEKLRSQSFNFADTVIPDAISDLSVDQFGDLYEYIVWHKVATKNLLDAKYWEVQIYHDLQKEIHSASTISNNSKTLEQDVMTARSQAMLDVNILVKTNYELDNIQEKIIKQAKQNNISKTELEKASLNALEKLENKEPKPLRDFFKDAVDALDLAEVLSDSSDDLSDIARSLGELFDSNGYPSPDDDTLDNFIEEHQTDELEEFESIVDELSTMRPTLNIPVGDPVPVPVGDPVPTIECDEDIIIHPDGSRAVTRVCSDGYVETTITYPDERIVITETFPENLGTTTTVIYPDGGEVTTTTHSDGSGETRYPDGTRDVTTIQPNGTKLTVYSDGSTETTRTNPDGSTLTLKSNGNIVTTSTYPDGSTATTTDKPDGTFTTTIRYPNGNEVSTTTNPDGTIDTTTTTENPDGTSTTIDSNGTTSTRNNDGTRTLTFPDGTTATIRR